MRVEFPGFFDLQVNGFAGVDFNTPENSAAQLEHAIDAIRATGVTRFLPTLITSSLERFSACARYISPDPGPRGAHPDQHVVPASVEDFLRRQDAVEGRIVLVTLAPEVPGAHGLIEHLVKSDI